MSEASCVRYKEEERTWLRLSIARRYIGGMLSTYQLLGEEYEHRWLVEQAQVLADGLSHGWYQGNRLPFNVSGELARRTLLS